MKCIPSIIIEVLVVGAILGVALEFATTEVRCIDGEVWKTSEWRKVWTTANTVCKTDEEVLENANK